MFKKYVNYQSPSKLYNTLSDRKKHTSIQVNLIKNGNASKDDVNKIVEMNKIADIAEPRRKKFKNTNNKPNA